MRKGGKDKPGRVSIGSSAKLRKGAGSEQDIALQEQDQLLEESVKSPFSNGRFWIWLRIAGDPLENLSPLG